MSNQRPCARSEVCVLHEFRPDPRAIKLALVSGKHWQSGRERYRLSISRNLFLLRTISLLVNPPFVLSFFPSSTSRRALRVAREVI